MFIWLSLFISRLTVSLPLPERCTACCCLSHRGFAQEMWPRCGSDLHLCRRFRLFCRFGEWQKKTAGYKRDTLGRRRTFDLGRRQEVRLDTDRLSSPRALTTKGNKKQFVSLIPKQPLSSGGSVATEIFFGEDFLAKSIITRRFADTVGRRKKKEKTCLLPSFRQLYLSRS